MKNGIHWNKAIGLACGVAVLTGCQNLAYVGANGERFNRFAFGSQTTISSLELETATNGLRRIRLQGYQADSTQAMGIVTEAAVRAALQGH